MQIENIVVMGEEEFEEALLEYVNKHKKTAYKSLSSIRLTNGTEESPVLMTGIKFKAV